MKIFIGLLQLVFALTAGLVCGFLLGQSSIGKLLPQAIGWITSALFSVALIHAYGKFIHLKYIASVISRPDLIVFIVSLVLSTSISAIPVWNLPSERLAGFMPFSDASNYFSEILNWPSDYFSDWGSRRPLNAMINITEFRLSGSGLLWIQFVKVSLLALSIAVFVYAMIKKVGVLPGWISGFVLLVWSWPFASSMLSEVNGITLSAAGMSVILLMDKSKSFLNLVTGLFLLALSYIVRPFNLLMPPLIGMVIAVHLADTKKQLTLNSIKVLIISLSLTLLGTNLLGLLYNSPSAQTNSNAMYSVLGLTRGTDWVEAMEFTHSENPGVSDNVRTKWMREMAIEGMQEHPELLMKSIIRGIKRMFIEFYGAIGCAFGIPKPQIGMQGQESVGNVIRYLGGHPYYFLIAFLLGAVLFVLFRMQSNRVLVWLCIVTLFSFVTIAPLTIIDAGWRIVANLYPGLAILPALVLVYIREHKLGGVLVYDSKARSSSILRTIPAFLLFFVLIAIPFPGIIRSREKHLAPLKRMMVLNIGNDKKGKWLSGNIAVVNSSQLLNSVGLDEISPVRNYLAKYERQISQIVISNDGYHIYVKGISRDSLLFPGWVSHPITPK